MLINIPNYFLGIQNVHQ